MELLGRQVGMMQGDRRQRDKSVGVCQHPLREPFVLREHDLGRQRALGRIPPVTVDAERLHVDALLIHDLQAFGAEVAAAAARLGERRVLDDLIHRNDAVRMDVDHFDATAAHHHLPACWR